MFDRWEISRGNQTSAANSNCAEDAISADKIGIFDLTTKRAVDLSCRLTADRADLLVRALEQWMLQ
jgi:hypothetical protein